MRRSTLLLHTSVESEGLCSCAAAELGDTDGDLVRRTGILRDALRSDGGALAIACLHQGIGRRPTPPSVMIH
ncbi:hypothetical protein [Dactylosporangium sp. CA-139066]|uniref:hypothetical protein n=1 Tax=Dactylosporangium sp. CA-139066 TaxID=3239930 RepID=UPI003D95020A